jgi:osmotically-inducible protein OsmY
MEKSDKGETMRNKTLLACVALTAPLLLLGGCAVPLVVGGAAVVGGAMVAADRRPVGIQIEDEAIERRIDRALAARFEAGTINVNVTSYNRKVLLTGEVQSQQTKSAAEEIARNTENVREVVNELGIGLPSTIGSRTNDTAISAKVRAAFIDSKEVQVGVVKLTTERAIVYLLGRVTEKEGEAAARVASRVEGVQKVVKVFDYLTDQELANMRTQEGAPQSPRKP